MDLSPGSDRVAPASLLTRWPAIMRRAVPPALRSRRAQLALTALGIVAALAYLVVVPTDARDARAYYDADLGRLYGETVGAAGAYVYPPLLAELVQPLRALPWPAFAELVHLGNVVALGIAAGPFSGPLLLTLPIRDDLGFGNINLWLGILVVAGLRWPALWAGVILTKITPGVGLLWFVGRRDWRSLAIAVGATIAVAAVAFVLAPGAWADWLTFVRTPASDPSGLLGGTYFPLRLAIAAVLATWAGFRNQAWALVIASMIAVPLLWPGTFAMLTPLVWLLWRHRPAPATTAVPGLARTR